MAHFAPQTHAERKRQRFFQLQMQRATVRDVVTVVADKALRGFPMEEWEDELVSTFKVEHW